MMLPAFDEGSFRDPEGHVFSYNDQIYRTLTPSAADRMKKIINSPFFINYMNAGHLIHTQYLDSTKLFPKSLAVSQNVLLHEKVANITYPFEWTFSMLKDGALLTLDLMKTLLDHDYILKDGTAWNICFNKGAPCFYDILSIDEYNNGQPWEGLSQFLQEFLYPLMFQAYTGLDFQPIWKSSGQGIPVSLLYKTLSKTDLFKRGVFKYVFLQEKLSSIKSVSEANFKAEFTAKTFSKETLKRMLDDLRTCIQNLIVTRDHSVWKKYDNQNTYKYTDAKEKDKFIQVGLESLSASSVIDLGCNTGRYSLIAANSAQVISCDLDPACVDSLYLKRNSSILPVVLNLMVPSPSMGWQLKERKDVFSRLKPDSFLALALIHHICIAYNVPLESFVKFLRSLAPRGIVEWVDKSDPMLQFLLRNRKDIFNNYTWDNFKSIIEQNFKIEKTLTVNNGMRTLLLLNEK